MRRKILIWVLTAAAGGIAFVGLFSMRLPISLWDTPGWGWSGGNHLRVHSGILMLAYSRSSTNTRLSSGERIQLPGFTYSTSEQYGGGFTPTGTPTGRTRMTLVRIGVSVWPMFLALAAYPAFCLVCVPLRAAHRRSRQLCHNCCYCLVGNESGVCPECGEPLVGGIMPNWQRITVAVLCAVIAAWLIEFVNSQFVLDDRIALWMIQVFRAQVGVWIITSLLRILPCSLICIGVYQYLSPERFPGKK